MPHNFPLSSSYIHFTIETKFKRERFIHSDALPPYPTQGEGIATKHTKK
jgi:hypothetical protein